MRSPLLLFLSILLIGTHSLAEAQTTFTVTNTDDSGNGSLRQAILDANDNVGSDVIAFDIPGDGPHTILPQTALPGITDPVTVDGLTEPGADCSAWPPTLMIELDGTNAGANADGLALVADSDGTVVRGLILHSFADNGAGILISDSDDNTIACNFIGTDGGGMLALANAFGVFVTNASDNRIGGPDAAQRNLISGNGNNVVFQNFDAAEETTGNRVEGNYLGTDVQGTAVIGSAGSSVGIVSASGNTIGGTAEGAGNVISGSTGNGITLFGTGVRPTTGNTIQGNYVGTDATGTQDLGNGTNGINLFNASENVVGGTAEGAGNVISGNGQWGIQVLSDGTVSGDGNTVQGNYVGTDVSGTQAIPNDFDGIILRNSSSNLVGGPEEDARNTISGNTFHGVVVLNDEGAPATRNNRVEGNYIGTDASGTQALGNGGVGVFLRERSRSTEIVGNVISANGDRGIFVVESAPDNLIQGNYVGTDATGTAALGNNLAGISLLSDDNVVGGTTAQALNVIGANTFTGIEVFGTAAIGNLIQGNYVGVGADGVTPLGNVSSQDASGNGITISNGALENTIGGEEDGAGNRIAFNEGAGIVVFAAETVDNALLGNMIYENDGLGIDLSDDGVTDNSDDEDGPNESQSYPVLTESILTEGGSGVRVEATLNSTPETTFRVEVFASPTCDPSGFGEGETFLGATEVTTDASGEAAVSEVFEADAAKGTFITATATNPEGNTSEFSECFEIITGVSVDDGANVPKAFALAANYPNPFNPQTTIRYALPEASAVRLVVYDVLGRQIKTLVDGVRPAGRHEATFEATDLPSGMYLYRLDAGSFTQTRRMLLVK
ncbi:MAG: T9SS type A sorting domain-containing protein [Bacteroidetes bacterium]|jgi:titin|nr:T9SS type A sorting domain-containing protein [Bacteroidota bacterium]